MAYDRIKDLIPKGAAHETAEVKKMIPLKKMSKKEQMLQTRINTGFLTLQNAL